MSQANALPSENDGSTSKIVALVALILAGTAAFLLKDKEHAAAIAALVGVAGAFAVLILGASRGAPEDALPVDDGASSLLAALERNRTEFVQQVAALRKDVAGCKADETAVREAAAVRAEIARLREAVAKL